MLSPVEWPAVARGATLGPGSGSESGSASGGLDGMLLGSDVDVPGVGRCRKVDMVAAGGGAHLTPAPPDSGAATWFRSASSCETRFPTVLPSCVHQLFFPRSPKK